MRGDCQRMRGQGDNLYLKESAMKHPGVRSSQGRWVVRHLLCVWMIALLPTQVFASEQPVTSSPVIQWAAWGAEAFERAQAEDKLILLDLTAVWCHACHVMDATTYVDPAVVALLNTAFVPVRVDTDQRPDIAARYRHGGWPTTSVLLPSGENLFQANALPPDAMLEVLRTSDAFYRENKRGYGGTGRPDLGTGGIGATGKPAASWAHSPGDAGPDP